LGAGFLALIVFTSSPFIRLNPAPIEGDELNPLLQDIGLAIHPPFLYLGYVGFSVTFAFAVAALIEGRVDASWARFVRPWILAAWCFLTVGIALGSFWAYYELGWGGWWFWDPVENASFMPWLVGTALLHSALVMERRGALVIWTLLLAILTFSLSLVGTFLVRSGVLTSVHAFSSDPARGVGVLLLLALSTGGALTLFAARASSFGRPVLFSPVSREGGLVLNNILLVTAAGTVFVGTFYPLFVDLITGDKISVGPPYFNRTFMPLMVPLILAVVVGMNLRWKRDTLLATLKRGRWALVPVVAAFAVALLLGGVGKLFGAFGLAIGLWLVFGSFAWVATRISLFRSPLERSLSLARTTPRALYGMVIAHIGLGLAVIGISLVSAWQQESIKSINPGEMIQIGGYDVRLDRVRGLLGPNYDAERAVFVVSKDGLNQGEIYSERRFYPSSGRQTTEAAISPRLLSNLYIAIGEPNAKGAWAVRAYWHPFVLLIWIGPLLMAFGGLVSLSDRRFRLGAPSRAPRPRPLVAGA
jgi:cytochrome c-type biogenesis protein CcmF